jgi:hypothetical protein
MKQDMSDWMQADEDGWQPIPHKNGKIKWYVLGVEEDGGHYVGEYDMTDWNTAWEVMWEKAKKMADKYMATEWTLLRQDQLIDIMFNVANCLYSSGDFKEEWVVGSDWYDWLEEEKEA